MKNIDPKLLQVFADVVDQGSFTAAADLRETNVSYITRQIKKLEAELNTTLLNRSTRALALTETGQRVYDNARQLNELVRNISVIAQQTSGEVRGNLRITSAVYIGRKFVFPIVEKLCDQYPELNIDLQLSDDQVDIIKERFDIAIRVWKPRDINLIAQKLADVRFLIAAAPEFIERYGRPESLEQLQSLPAVIYGRKGHINKTLNYLDDAGKLRTFHPNANLCINDAEQMNLCVAKGERYYMPTNFMVADKLQSGELVQLLPELKIPDEGAIYGVYPNRALPTAARLIMDELKTALAICEPIGSGRS